MNSEIEKIETITNYLGITNIILASLTALATIAIFIYSNRLAKLKDKEADVKITNANQKATDAAQTGKALEIQVKQLDIQLAEAKTKQAEAETAHRKLIEEIAEKQKPRKLSSYQKIKLKSELSKNHPNIMKQILISCLAGDTEALNYGNELCQVFTDAGWFCGSVGQMTSLKGFAGIILVTPVNDKNQYSNSYPFLKELLTNLKIDFKEEFVPVNGSDYTNTIFIGSKD